MSPLFLVVPKAEGEVVRKKLLDMDALDNDFRIETERDAVLFPVRREVDLGFELVEHVGREVTRAPKSYRELVDVPDEIRPLLPTSFDVIGDVIVVKLVEELLPFSQGIGSAMMKAYRGIRTVALDEGVRGDYRIRKLRVLCGGESLTTVHRAYGVDLQVDLAKCYFSPRIATETWRIAGQVRKDEIVVDMFSGVGPFALTIAKHAEPERVYAIDSNPHAIAYLEKNIARNKILSVTPILADSGAAIEGIGNASRVILDLPHSSIDYFAPAVRAVSEGYLHYYEILETTIVEDRIARLCAIAKEMGRTAEIVNKMKVRTFSPSEAHYAFDIRIE